MPYRHGSILHESARKRLRADKVTFIHKRPETDGLERGNKMSPPTALSIAALGISVFSLALNTLIFARALRKLIHSWQLLGKGDDRDDEGEDADDNGGNRCAGLDDIK